MIDHLKIKDYKGVKNVVLNNIGAINIVCGKNNSGKSSILEGLEKIGIVGCYFADYQIISDRWKTMFIDQPNEFHHECKLMFDLYFTKYFKENGNVIYEDEVQSINENLQVRIEGNSKIGRFVRINFGQTQSLMNSFFAEIKTEYSRTLIPAKRIHVYEDNFSSNAKTNANGQGLLNHLFYLKNQDLSSDDFVKFKNIHTIFKEITGIEFNVVPTQTNSIKLRFRVVSDWLDGDQCGLGLVELLAMITFISTTSFKIILLEEPENHLHADFQKKFINFLKSIEDKKFIIASHSNVFIDNLYADKIFFCWFDKEVKVSDKTSVSKIIDSLGYSISENLVSDAIIFTEGPTDIPILKRLLTLNGTMSNFNIKFLTLGGDIMASLDLSLFENLNKVFAIIDCDPGSTKIRNTFQKNCKASGIICYKLERYSIENYIPISILKAQFLEIPKSIKSIEPDKSVDEQIGFKAKNKTIKSKNYEMVLKMKIDDIVGTDLLNILNQIKKFLDER